jgi:segregation and condensation protein A
VHERGMPEGVRVTRESSYTATVYDLLKAYADQRKRTIRGTVTIKPRVVWSIKDARQRLERLIGAAMDWRSFESFLNTVLPSCELTPTVTASSFGAALEMAREGHVELRQTEAFGPIYLRLRRRGDQLQPVK